MVCLKNHKKGCLTETERSIGSVQRYYWMNPEGEFIKVRQYGHDEWATDFLTKYNMMPDDGDVFTAMAKLGWYRVVFFYWSGTPTIEYSFLKSHPPSRRQLKSIKDLGIELGAQDIVPVSF
jgi:hypothetical protein